MQNSSDYNQIAADFSATRQRGWADFAFFAPYLRPGMKILDLGCGNGRLVEFLKNKISLPPENYLGLDLSEGLIDQAKKAHPEFRFAVADMRALDLAEKFDAVIMVASFCHLPKHEQARVLELIKKVLNPGGVVLMLNWNLWNPHNRKSVWRTGQWLGALCGRRFVKTFWGQERQELFYYAFTKKELTRLLRSAGFEVLACDYLHEGKKAGWWGGEYVGVVGKYICKKI